MTEQARGPTMIALRARRQAYHVASDILYEEPIDLRTVDCFRCGAHYNASVATVTEPTCARCGAPLALTAYIMPPVARYAEWVPLDLPDRSTERLIAEIERELDDTVRSSILWFVFIMTMASAVVLFFAL